MYKVIRLFADLQDNRHIYNVGDTFPHKECSYSVSEQRFAETAADPVCRGQTQEKEGKESRRIGGGVNAE